MDYLETCEVALRGVGRGLEVGPALGSAPKLKSRGTGLSEVVNPESAQ